MWQWVERYFQLEANHTSIRRECIAGLTTFSTMAYIVFVNPQVLSLAGMDIGGVMVATILSASFASILMGLLANYPFALAPGMGLNAFFTYSIVLGQGYSWQLALGMCFVAGCIFLGLTLTGFRRAIIHAIPVNLRLATTAGIGLFLAFIGLQNVEMILPHPETLVTLGHMTRPEIGFTLFGLIVIAVLMSRRFPFAILASIIINWVLGLAFGLVEWQGVIALPPPITPVFLQLDIIGVWDLALIPIILSFVLVALFDAAGTLMSLAHQGNFLAPNGRLPRANQALFSDATGIVAGSLLGTSMLTTYLESATGIAAGGKTGLTAVTVGVLFLATLFFVPIVSSIPLFATAPALIAIGVMMMSQLKEMEWEDPSETVPAFLVIIGIPLSFSVATGIALGFLTYPVIKLLIGKRKEVHPLIWVTAALFAIKFVVQD